MAVTAMERNRLEKRQVYILSRWHSTEFYFVYWLAELKLCFETAQNIRSLILSTPSFPLHYYPCHTCDRMWATSCLGVCMEMWEVIGNIPRALARRSTLY